MSNRSFMLSSSELSKAIDKLIKECNYLRPIKGEPTCIGIVYHTTSEHGLEWVLINQRSKQAWMPADVNWNTINNDKDITAFLNGASNADYRCGSFDITYRNIHLIFDFYKNVDKYMTKKAGIISIKKKALANKLSSIRTEIAEHERAIVNLKKKLKADDDCESDEDDPF